MGGQGVAKFSGILKKNGTLWSMLESKSKRGLEKMQGFKAPKGCAVTSLLDDGGWGASSQSG